MRLQHCIDGEFWYKKHLMNSCFIAVMPGVAAECRTFSVCWWGSYFQPLLHSSDLQLSARPQTARHGSVWSHCSCSQPREVFSWPLPRHSWNTKMWPVTLTAIKYCPNEDEGQTFGPVALTSSSTLLVKDAFHIPSDITTFRIPQGKHTHIRVGLRFPNRVPVRPTKC